MPEIKPQRLIIGLGSHHGDDQIGWKLAEELGRLTDIPFRQAAVPADILLWLAGIDELYICDACQNAGQPGKLHKWTYQSDQHQLDEALADLESLHSINTHQMSLAATLNLGQRLKMLPPFIVIWAIEGAAFSVGQSVTDELKDQLPDLVNRLAGVLHHA